jgi:hypothetical protein
MRKWIKAFVFIWAVTAFIPAPLRAADSKAQGLNSDAPLAEDVDTQPVTAEETKAPVAAQPVTVVTTKAALVTQTVKAPVVQEPVQQPKEGSMSGVVVFQDAKGGSLAVKDSAGATTTVFIVDAKTNVSNGGSSAKLESLKAGDKVKVGYSEQYGKRTAVTVSL